MRLVPTRLEEERLNEKFLSHERRGIIKQNIEKNLQKLSKNTRGNVRKILRLSSVFRLFLLIELLRAWATREIKIALSRFSAAYQKHKLKR